jgi:hypothetical protein
VWTADVEDEEALQLWELDHLDTVRRQELTNATRWLASRMRFELILQAIGVHAFRPRLEGNLCGFHCLAATATRQPHALLARRPEDRATVGVARCGCGRRTRCAPATAAGGIGWCATATIGYADLHAWTLWLLLLRLAVNRFPENRREEQRSGSAQR